MNTKLLAERSKEFILKHQIEIFMGVGSFIPFIWMVDDDSDVMEKSEDESEQNA